MEHRVGTRKTVYDHNRNVTQHLMIVQWALKHITIGYLISCAWRLGFELSSPHRTTVR